MAVAPAPLIHPSRIVNRWVQLVAGIIAMMAIANLQYAWTLFTKPMQNHLHVSLAAIQGIFSLFIIVETWLVPFEGYLVDRIGPRLMLGIGADSGWTELDLRRSGRELCAACTSGTAWVAWAPALSTAAPSATH